MLKHCFTTNAVHDCLLSCKSHLGLQERDQAVQKKAYKVLAYICEHRPDFLLPHFGEVLAELQAGVTSSMSAAKRFRLRCLKAVILLLEGPQGSQLLGGAVTNGGEGADGPEHQQVGPGVTCEALTGLAKPAVCCW